MPAPDVYEYAFIRYVPRVERGECINVGVIVFCKRQRYVGVKYHLDPTRILALYPTADLDELAHYLHTWTLIATGNPDGGRIATLDPAGRFRWLTAARSTIIQPSQVHPGRTSEPDVVLEELFGKYVLG